MEEYLTLQAHQAAKVSNGDLQCMPDLLQTQERITNWFASRAREVFLHASIKEVADSEKTLIFHHEQLKKSRKRVSTLKLTGTVPPSSRRRLGPSLTTLPSW